MVVDLGLKVVLLKLLKKLEKVEAKRSLPAPVPFHPLDSTTRRIFTELNGNTDEEREMIRIRVLNDLHPKTAEPLEEKKVENDESTFDFLKIKNHYLVLRPRPVIISGVEMNVVVE